MLHENKSFKWCILGAVVSLVKADVWDGERSVEARSIFSDSVFLIPNPQFLAKHFVRCSEVSLPVQVGRAALRCWSVNERAWVRALNVETTTGGQALKTRFIHLLPLVVYSWVTKQTTSRLLSIREIKAKISNIVVI